MPRNIVVEEQKTYVIETGVQGPPGPPGTGTIADAVNYLEFVLDAGHEVTQGQLAWNPDEETLDLGQNGAVLQVGQEVHWHVRNGYSDVIPNGTPVMAIGTIGASSRIIVTPMDGTSKSNAKYFLGVATEDIEIGGDGKVTHFGKVRGINTSLWNEGDVLWISDQNIGELTNIEPEGIGLPIAFVVTKHEHQGALAVRVSTLDEHLYLKREEYTSKDYLEKIAGETISQFKVVKVENDLVFLGRSSNLGDNQKIVGVAVTGGNSGSIIKIQNDGELVENTWNWNEGSIFVNEFGELTQTPPSTGFILKVGKALSPTKILINIQQAIVR